VRKKKAKTPEDLSADFTASLAAPLKLAPPKVQPDAVAGNPLAAIEDIGQQQQQPILKPAKGVPATAGACARPDPSAAMPMEVAGLPCLGAMTSDQLAQRLKAVKQQPQKGEPDDGFSDGFEQPTPRPNQKRVATLPDVIGESESEQEDEDGGHAKEEDEEDWGDVGVPESLPAFQGIHTSADYGGDEETRGLAVPPDRVLQLQGTPTSERHAPATTPHHQQA
jgi:hypothetical protein